MYLGNAFKKEDQFLDEIRRRNMGMITDLVKKEKIPITPGVLSAARHYADHYGNHEIYSYLERALLARQNERRS